MWQDFGRGGCLIFWLLLIAATNFATCETDTEVLKPVDEVEELSIDAEFPITEGPPQTTVKPECVRLPEAGVLFTSDNFPGKYLKDTNCTYKMRAVEGSRVQLTFYVFDTESNPRCSYDLATVFDSNGTIIHKYCGKNTKNLQVTSSTEDLSFNFKTDGVQESMGFLASWEEVGESTDQTDTEGKYLISFPRSFIEESPEKICIELFDSDKSDGTIETQVFINDKEDKDSWIFGESPVEKQTIEIKAEEKLKCFDFTLPKTKESKGLLNIKVNFKDSTYSVNSFKEITILKKENYPLIQTDKGQYKAKDDVKFRVLLVDHNLKPSEIKTIEELWVEDPRNRRIVQWKDQGLDKGLMQQGFKLSEEPELGTWTINFKAGPLKEKTTFTVSEYVLPKFEVTIEPPAAVLRDTLEAEWKVCAKYTHGGSVKGQVKANFTSTYQRRTWRPPPPIVKNIEMVRSVSADDDCATVMLNSEQIKELTEKVDNFDLQIEFEEEGTGTAEKSKWSGSLVDEAIKLDIGSSSQQFILGGFPYVAEFSVNNHDDSPREDDIEVCVRLFKDANEIRNLFNRRGIWSMDEDEIAEIGKKMVDIKYSSKCHQVRSENGKIKFYVPMNNIPKDVTKLSIKATAINHPANETTKMKQPMRKLDVSLTHTTADLTLSVKEKQRSKISCGEDFKAKVYFSSKPSKEFDLHYHALSKGMIFKSGSIKVSTEQTNALESLVGQAKELSASESNNEKESNEGKVVSDQEIILPIDYKVSPSLKLVVFINDGNQTLTDSHTYDVEACQNHKVKAEWSEEKVYPGSPVTLSVAAEPDSLCAISATDKSVDLLGNKNKVTSETIGKLQAEIGDRKTSRSENYWEYQRKCPQTYDAIKVYESTGIQILTDLSFINSCETITDAKNEPEYEPEIMHSAVAFSVGGGQTEADYDEVAYDAPVPVAQVENRVASMSRPSSKVIGASNPEKPKVALRNFFPESWLFELITVKEEELKSELTSPHTITTWIGEAICMNNQFGLGVSNPTSLLVNQDFFAEIRLPYSVKRGETFPLNVTVFNYIDVELPIRVKLITSEEEVQSDKSEFDICIGPNDNKVITLKTTALKLGELNVTVEAVITNGIKDCKDVTEGNGYKDALVRQLRVKPEGVPIEKVESDFKCFESGKEKFQMSKLEVPSDAVSDSERAWVYVTGDIMAPALENVGNLVRLPTGCGEQNMVGLVPNIYLLQYLDSTNQKEPELERKAKEFMEIGYNRQQKYNHPNGAYSIWGDKGDKDGSTWLTAFVVKSFSEASQYIEVDTNLVQRSVNWLMKGQMENGCFRKRGYVHSSYLKGGGSDDSLTPFVVTALLEAKSRIGVKILPNKLVEAVDCMLRTTNTTDVYSTIVTAHAANLLSNKLKMQTEDKEKNLDNLEMTTERKEQIEDLMEDIINRANSSEPGSRFWDNERKLSKWGYYYTSSEAVEMTAYNVMSFTLRDEVPKALDSVKWLARQRNSQGGFVSTQDTVVALQALSMYAQRVTRIPLDMTVDVTEKHETINKLNTFRMNEKNSLLLQTQKLTKLPSKLVLDTDGAGCAMVQTVLRYNMPEVQENNGFTITAQGNTNTIDDPSLTICATYTGTEEKTGMVLIEVELVTGWEAVSPESLKNEVDSGVQRVEQDEKENKVVLYFDSMPKEEKCINLELKQVMDIEDAKEALVTVYDYNNSKESASVLYSLN
eukprot:TRINITY_DN20713_c0_g1_i4.p1 TRINITY_DN20713_c0_g1~~TRINITY_DN20713_c0_g1_i4.p1  ORF type:complete len:1703 (-),score=467.37 TRINITY_DN20713_c0_g1_i4:343-5451(-)